MNEYWNDSPYMLWREANSIMHITYKKNLVIDIETAQQIVNERLSFFEVILCCWMEGTPNW